MPLSDHSGKNSFNLNNKSFTNRGASGGTPIYDIASSGGSGAALAGVAQAGDEITSLRSAVWASSVSTKTGSFGGTVIGAQNGTWQGSTVQSYVKIIEYVILVGGTYRVHWTQYGHSEPYTANTALYLNEQLTDSANVLTRANYQNSEISKTVDLDVQVGDYISIYGKTTNPYGAPVTQTADERVGYPQGLSGASGAAALKQIKFFNADHILVPPRMVYIRYNGNKFSGIASMNEWDRNP